MNLPLLRKNAFAELDSTLKVNQIKKGDDVTYQVLKAYYDQNGLYESLMASSFYLSLWHEGMKPLRNPANRSVEFFVDKVMPGTLPDALPILTDNEAIIEPIHEIWKWSNLNAKKPVLIRWLAIYGDLFIHPVMNSDGSQTYMEFIEPQYVTDFTKDKRDHITSIRIDIPMGKGMTHTEYWDLGSYAIWEHKFGVYKRIEDLPAPMDFGSLSDFGIDFVPFVHSKFRDVGEKRGVGAFTHCLDKIDEANRMVTRLHQILFRHNKPIWALQANAVDDDGIPIPPPAFDSSALDEEDDSVLRIPGNGSLNPMIPNIQYDAALEILQDHMLEVEKDLPELALTRLRDKGELSGRAVKLFLSDAVSRAEEARANFEHAVIKAESMCLTLGANLGIFPAIGNYDAGDFDHQFKVREIFETDKAPSFKELTDAGVGVYDALKLIGFNDDEIPDALKAQEAPQTPNPNPVDNIVPPAPNFPQNAS